MLLDGRIVFIVGGLHPPWNGLVTEENYAGNKDPSGAIAVTHSPVLVSNAQQ